MGSNWIDILFKIAGTGFSLLVGVLVIYFALRLLGKFLKIVVTVVVVIAVLFAIWFFFLKDGVSLPFSGSVTAALQSAVFLPRFGV